MDDCFENEEKETKTHPYDAGGWISKLTFFYTLKLFCARKSLTFNAIKSCASQEVCKILEVNFDALGANKSLYKLLFRTYGRRYFSLGCIQLIWRLFFISMAPMAIGKLIHHFESPSASNPIVYAALVVGIHLINAIYMHNYLLILARMGLEMRTAFTALIYRQMLRNLRNIDNAGRLFNVLTKDVAAFEVIVFYANDIWVGLAQAALVGYLIYLRVGGAAVAAGFSIVLLLMPIQIWLGKRTKQLRLKVAQATDDRLLLFQQIIGNIKMVKTYNFQSMFQDKLTHVRKRELKGILIILCTKIAIPIIGALNSKVAFFALILTCIWVGQEHILTAELVYFILSSFQRLRHSLNVIIPTGIAEASELVASLKRIHSILTSEHNLSYQICYSNDVAGTVLLENITLFNKDEIILRDVNFKLSHGVNLIGGSTSCGKTALLRLLSENFSGDVKKGGKISISGRVSYCTKNPWIFPGSVRENILCGQEFLPLRYNKVLEVCALTYDLRLFNNYDSSFVSENNLSNGQMARINLARAIYRQADIYLLDDCLSCLDVSVRSFVFRECVQEFLRGKTVIFATHHFDEYSDKVDTFSRISNTEVFKASVKKHVEGGNLENVKAHSECEREFETNDDEKGENDRLLVKKEKPKVEFIKKEYIPIKVYKNVVDKGGGTIVIFFILSLFIMNQITKNYSDLIISEWVNLFGTKGTEYDVQRIILLKYSLMLVLTSILSVLSAISLLYFMKTVSCRIHSAMTQSVMNAWLSFFENTSIGNILNRFSKDLAILDEKIAVTLYDLLELFLTIAGVMLLLATIDLFFLIPFMALLSMLYWMRRGYLATGRILQRLEVATRSPLMGTLNATLNGWETIKSNRELKTSLMQQFDRQQDCYTSICFSNLSTNRAFGFVMDLICNGFVVFVISYFFYFNPPKAGQVGLALIQSFSLLGLLQYAVRKWADLETQMTSVERLIDFTNLPSDTGAIQNGANAFPDGADLKFENVCLSIDGKSILSDLNFSIGAGDKVAVVGRTGAGKTSLISLLLRFYEYRGRILVGGTDLRAVDLKRLRDFFGVVMSPGAIENLTVREYLNSNSASDNELWTVLETVGLKSVVQNLDAVVKFDNSQILLLSFAGILLKQRRIVLMDEISVSIDTDTENLINNIFRKYLKSSTIFAITHQLENIDNFDKVLLVDNGHIVEFDFVKNLLNNPQSNFYKMFHKKE